MTRTDKSEESLRGEIARLKADLEKARAHQVELEETRRAMLYLLEDLNATTADIAKAKNEWELTFDSISDPLFIHDAEFRIVRCNRAYQAAAGREFKKIVGLPYYRVFPRMKGPFMSCVREMKEKSGHEDAEEVVVPAINKVFKVRFYSTHGDDPVGQLSIHVLEDITEDKKAEEKERFLFDFSHKCASKIDMEFRLSAICDAVHRLGYPAAWIGFLNEKTGDIVPSAETGLEGMPHVIRPGDPLSEPAFSALKNRRPEKAGPRRFSEGLSFTDKPADRRQARHSALALPLVEQDHVGGVLNIYSLLPEFPERETGFLQTFANQAAAYIRNSNLFEKVKESAEKIKGEMELTEQLLMIANATAQTTDIDRLMEHVVKSVQTIMNSTLCLSYLWDRERRVFQPCRGSGLSYDRAVFFKSGNLNPKTPFVAASFKSRSPVIEFFGPEGRQASAAESGHGPVSAPDKGAGDAWHAVFSGLVEDLSAVVVIPLIGRKDTLGLLVSVYDRQSSRYTPLLTDRERKLLRGISAQVSTAIHEARLYKESIDTTLNLSRKIETIQTMHEIDRAILSTLDPGEILETAAVMIGKLFPCERSTVALVNEDKDALIYAGGFGLGFMGKGAELPMRETSAGEVVLTARPECVANLASLKELLPFEKKLLKDGFLSHIRVPLTVKDEVIGVLTVGSRRQAAFSPEDLSTIEKLAYQVSIALENARLLKDLEELFLGVVRSLSEAIDAKSPWTRGHSDRVTGYALTIGRQMGLTESEIKDLELAGLLHDVGKLGTYESILDKPGALNEEEVNVMKLHPDKGAEILKPIKQMKKIMPVIKHHHECYGGSGYPDGLKGEEIPLMARILAVADTVDAMGADRPYRKGKPMTAIVAELRRCSGTQFDPAVVEAFLRTDYAKVA